jgi:hypothetical protein
MLDTFNFASPQSANYQEFFGGDSPTNSTHYQTRTWLKPRGVSMVRFMLIGAGGGGGIGSSVQGGGGGGSGAVTSWIGPAIFIPDNLVIHVGRGGVSGTDGDQTSIFYQAKDGLGYGLLYANGGASGTTSVNGGAGGIVATGNSFTASGISTFIAGQNGAAGSATGAGTAIGASSTTFLSGGAGGAGAAASTGGAVATNYGYPALAATTAGGTVVGKDGYFITQPILLGLGGAGGTTSTTVGTAGGRGGIGCGGGGSGEDAVTSARGGDGAVFIWAW